MIQIMLWCRIHEVETTLTFDTAETVDLVAIWDAAPTTCAGWAGDADCHWLVGFEGGMF